VIQLLNQNYQEIKMKSFSICKKLNYATETPEKQHNVDKLSLYIKEKMFAGGFVEAPEKSKTIDYVFSIGGDGTMLHSMRNHVYKGSIVIGVNAGNVGFLTPYNIEDILSSDVVSLINECNNPRIEKRSMLSDMVNHEKGYAVNDYAITATEPNEMVDFSIEIEHRDQISRAGYYRANALVVSGPCGSTAYNMNAGGAIVDPVVKCMQIVMVAPTTLGARPLIISKMSTIHITVHSKAKVFSDGILSHDLSLNEKFSIKLMQKESNILVPQDWNFFSVLAKKLHWNNGRDV
jgi:NAD+ kinase